MQLAALTAESDLVGRRIRVRWTVRFAPGETVADVPPMRLRRKTRDWAFPPPEPGQPDPFAAYDSLLFPPAGRDASDLPVEERREGELLHVTAVTSVHHLVGGRFVETLRRTQTTTFDAVGRPVERRMDVLDIGDGLGGLVPNTTYYYVLESPVLATGLRASARPGQLYGMGPRMYEMLPGIHRRFDTAVRAPTPGAEAVPEARPTGGQLRRLLDVFGAALDGFRTTAEGLRGLRDLAGVDARYLPLLARHIGWELGRDVPVPTQRNEIRYAPALYRLTGSIPGAHVWTERSVGWEPRVKEYVHNVFRASRPSDLNVWARVRRPGGWTDPDRPLRLDAAPAGRPALAELPDGSRWLFYHADRMRRTGVWGAVRPAGGPWSASVPLTSGPTLDTHPAAAARPDGTLFLFWTAHDAVADRWQVRLRLRDVAGVWGPPQPWLDADTPRRWPATTTDAAGNVWLFWLEAAAVGAGRRDWRVRYARFDGAWSAPVDLPADGGAHVRPEGPPAVLAFDTPGRRLWLFWSRTVPGNAPGQTRRALFVRTRSALTPTGVGWGASQPLSALPPDAHDDDPAPFVNPDGDLELAFASNRARGWSLWSRTFDAAADAWNAEAALPATDAVERHPLPFVLDGEPAVLYRSDRPPLYRSPRPEGIQSLDFRYAGALTPHVGHPEALALRGRFGDVGHYTYDLGDAPGLAPRTDRDRYADDTVGLFLTPDTLDGATLADRTARLRQVMALALPATERAVLVLEPDAHLDYVYDYARPGAPDPRLIDEAYRDDFTSALGTVVFSDGFDFVDALS